eukprot:COSAG03_NODE_1345_length_4286_cov_10.887509_2_plen_344_part_00
MPAEQEEVPAWLKANNLGMYADKFMELGYDDLEDLCEYEEDEFRDLVDRAEILPGHANKLRHRLKARGTGGAETAATNTTAGPAAKRSPPASEEDHTASRTAKKSRTEGTEHDLNGPSGAPASSDVEGAHARSAGPRAPDSSAPQSNENLADEEPARSNRRLSAPFSPVSVPQMVERGVPKNGRSDGEDPEAAAWDDDGDGDALHVSPPSLGSPDADEDGSHSLHANDVATKGHSASTEQMAEQDVPAAIRPVAGRVGEHAPPLGQRAGEDGNTAQRNTARHSETRSRVQGERLSVHTHVRTHAGVMPAKKTTDFKNDEVVWVKLDSHPWWPARVALDQNGTL